MHRIGKILIVAAVVFLAIGISIDQRTPFFEKFSNIVSEFL